MNEMERRAEEHYDNNREAYEAMSHTDEYEEGDTIDFDDITVGTLPSDDPSVVEIVGSNDGTYIYGGKIGDTYVTLSVDTLKVVEALTEDEL